ncbi:uncharacterized protein LOC131574918 isoform X3 [Poecile atricapillus]|uniref:uncharacterized protein LOC131574918 isoform X3 n=1 Tax=Poecile atricapillus TaxID=48891 RepID=UPI002738696B|nr:uncharacterized protein LOC131574918 isoform X3 [Poecile atricapillus]
MGFQAWLPLPLPKQLVVFGLGDWSCYSPDTSIAVDVLVSPDVAPQRVGTLEPSRRSLVWEDDWRTDIFMASLKEMDKGNPVRLVLTVSGQLLRGVSSSTPARSFLVPETTQSPVLPADDRPLGQDLEDPTGVKSQSSEVAARASRPVKKNIQPPLRTVVVPCALKSPDGKVESSEAWRKSPNQGPPRVHSKKPRKVLFEPTASEKDLDEEDLAVKELQGEDLVPRSWFVFSVIQWWYSFPSTSECFILYLPSDQEQAVPALDGAMPCASVTWGQLFSLVEKVSINSPAGMLSGSWKLTVIHGFQWVSSYRIPCHHAYMVTQLPMTLTPSVSTSLGA